MLAGLVGSPNDVVVLMAGLPGDVASAVSRRLSAKGIRHDRQLFANVLS